MALTELVTQEIKTFSWHWLDAFQVRVKNSIKNCNSRL